MLKSKYANTEQECVSVCYGPMKFHTYIYGRYITVTNNHKPLEMLQPKPIYATPLHLQ